MARVVENSLAQGFYTVPEAARLIQVGSTRRIYGWLRGYPSRDIGPLLERDFAPLNRHEELSFLDLMEVRFVEHFREHGVKLRSLRIAAKRLKQELKTSHPFAFERIYLLADKVDVYIQDVLKESAGKAEDKRLRSLLSGNYVMQEMIKQSLLPGVYFDPNSRLAKMWTPVPERFPQIVVDPLIAFGQPAGPKHIPTRTLYDAWVAEKEDADSVAYWYEVAMTDVLDAVKFEKFLDRRSQEHAA